MTQSKGTEPLVSGVKKAALHFSRAAIEVVSGVADLVKNSHGIVVHFAPGAWRKFPKHAASILIPSPPNIPGQLIQCCDGLGHVHAAM